jgi:hypothetical protein
MQQNKEVVVNRKLGFLLLASAVFLLVIAAFPLTAQQTNEDGTSVYYVKSLVITQVALGDYGYRVTYLNGRGKLHYAYIPHSWFSAAAGKGEQIETWNHAAPFMQVYYRDGAFSTSGCS